MATAKDFVDQVDKIVGVAGCLLVRDDGLILGQTLGNVENYSALMQISSGLANDIMTNVGFSHCHYLSFNRVNEQNFYVFPIDRYLLGIIRQADCSAADILERVFYLIGKVSTNGASSVV